MYGERKIYQSSLVVGESKEAEDEIYHPESHLEIN